MGSLVLYTPIPELWEKFNKIVNISSSNMDTGFSILMAKDYMESLSGYRNWTMKEFWFAMEYFLHRLNSDYYTKRRLKQLQIQQRNSNG